MIINAITNKATAVNELFNFSVNGNEKGGVIVRMDEIGICVKADNGVNPFKTMLLDFNTKSVVSEITTEKVSDGVLAMFNKTNDFTMQSIALELAQIENIQDFTF